MITLAIYSIAMIGGIFTLSSFAYRYRQRRYLNTRLDTDQSYLNRAREQFGIVEGTVISVSLFDVLYNLSKADPFVLAGIDHLHHTQSFTNLGELTSFLKGSIISSDQGSTAWRQMIHKYKGYTGEETAFDGLREAGHQVEVPLSGTHPDVDAIVDGQKINMAITDNPAYIQHKLDNLPEDVLVYTNSEMAGAFEGNSRVIIDSDISAQEMFHDTAETFAGIDELGDFIDDIPVITLVVSSIKNGVSVKKGNKTIGDAVEHTALDTAGVGFGGYAGSQAGLYLGLLLAPATGGTSAVIIPVASTVIGSIMGILSGKGVTNWIKERHLRRALKSLRENSADLMEKFVLGFESIIDKVEGQHKIFLKKLGFLSRHNEGWFKRTFYPSVLSLYTQMAKRTAKKDIQLTSEMYRELWEQIDAEDPVESGLLIYSQGKEILCGTDDLDSIWDSVDNDIKRVEAEQKKLA